LTRQTQRAAGESRKIIELDDDWAVRKLLICVRDVKALPVFAADLVNMLVADAESVSTR
jgi:hypothetical protein